MKILLVNYHHFINGGPDRYMFNVKALFESNGHKVIVFSFNYEETIESEFRVYFPDPITGYGKCLLSQNNMNLKRKFSAALKMFVNSDVEIKFNSILNDFNPDIVYSIYLSSTMLPSIFRIARKKNIPVFYRLSDYHLFCASYIFSNNGKHCDRCKKTPLYALKDNCVKDSAVLTVLRVLQIYYFRIIKSYDNISAFVSPSLFMKKVLENSRYKKIENFCIPTFAYDKIEYRSNNMQDRILFFGNVIREKGIEVLLNAFCDLYENYDLDIIGKYEDGYLRYLMSIIPDKKKKYVHFWGFLDGEELWKIIGKAKMMVHPVLCYENLPNSVIEVMSMGIPIIASKVGSMPELIDDGKNGYLFKEGDNDELVKKISMLFKESNYFEMSKYCRKYYLERYSPKSHYDMLVALFENAKKQK